LARGLETTEFQRRNRLVSAFVRHGSTIVVSKCKSEKSERKRRRGDEKEKKKRDVEKWGRPNGGVTARLRWLRLIVFAASLLSFSQYTCIPEYVTSGDHFSDTHDQL